MAGSKADTRLAPTAAKNSVKQFGDYTSPRKYKGLAEGKFKFKVRATDAAGNVDPSPAKDKLKVIG